MDFMQIMLDHNEVKQTEPNDAEKSSVHDQVLTDAEVISQAFVFFTAGYETTASALMFISYNRK